MIIHSNKTRTSCSKVNEMPLFLLPFNEIMALKCGENVYTLRTPLVLFVNFVICFLNIILYDTLVAKDIRMFTNLMYMCANSNIKIA
uniref:Uncharacterized protein n=1 Tax=Ciona intestinalis TaxID=7719 RepID=F7AS45_CIOIN